MKYIGFLFFVFVLVLSAGCTESAQTGQLTDVEFFEEIAATGEKWIEIYDDVYAQTKTDEQIKSLEGLYSFTGGEAKRFAGFQLESQNLTTIQYFQVDALKSSQQYAAYMISYLKTGDLNDLAEAKTSQMDFEMDLELIMRLIAEYQDLDQQN